MGAAMIAGPGTGTIEPGGELSAADTLDKPDSRDPAGAPPRAAVAAVAEPWRATAAGTRLVPTGTVLGEKIEVGDLLGEGGMGQVYVGYDRWLGRHVAVKVGGPEFGTNVLAEARAMAALRHPSVAGVYYGGHHEGLAYAVMELVHGPSLEAYLRRTPPRAQVPLGDALELLVGISQALTVVHEAGIAHRDVKPANVLLAPGNRIVLTDFGIFRPEIFASAAADPAGSPAYMAPETLTGDVRRGEAYLVDVYALGVVAFEVLTKELPFPSDAVARVIQLHLTEAPPDLRERRPEVPPRLASLVAEMLAKDPRSRPASMQEVTWRLQHLGSGRLSPDGARPLPPPSSRRAQPPLSARVEALSERLAARPNPDDRAE